MNELTDVMPTTPECEVQETPRPTVRRANKAKEEKPAAEFVSAKVKLRLLRAYDLNGDGKITNPGEIIEVDEATANELLRPFSGMPSHYGYRPGKVTEKIYRAEKVN